MSRLHERIDDVLRLVGYAETAIMHLYNNGGAVPELKADGTQVTRADKAAHIILTTGFSELFPDMPVVSEEGDQEENQEIVRTAENYILVDPIDGTRQFVDRTGMFSIGVAEIQYGLPVQGIVAVPHDDELYYGGRETGSYLRRANGGVTELVPLHVRSDFSRPGVLVQSHSHHDTATDAYASEHYPGFERRVVGSQMKFTQIAAGEADVYPRLASRLCLWDVAPGQAIVEGAGGKVTTLHGSALKYNSGSLQTGDFIATNGLR